MSRAKPSSQLPYLVEGDAIAGSVSLNLNEETKIKSVKISVSVSDFTRCVNLPYQTYFLKVVGELLLSGNDRFNFLKVVETLWSRDKGFPTISDTAFSRQSPHAYKGKLSGEIS